MRRAAFASACIFLGLLLALEAGLRWAGDDRLPSFFVASTTRTGIATYQLRPGASQTYAHQQRSVRVTISPDGWRVSGSSQSGYVIHVIGDSQVFGWGLSDHETIPARLQSKFGSNVRVVNRGLPGAGPHYYLSQLREVPDSDAAVVVFTETNDLQDTYSPLPVAREHCGFIVVPGGLSEWMPCFLLRSQSFGLFVDVMQSVFPEKTPVPLCYNPHLQVACQLAIYRATDRLAELARRRAGPTIFLTIPWEGLIDSSARSRYSPELASPMTYYGHARLPQHERVLERLRQMAAGAYQWDDHHLSAAGAAAVADLTAQLICEERARRELLGRAQPGLGVACGGA